MGVGVEGILVVQEGKSNITDVLLQEMGQMNVKDLTELKQVR